MATKSYKKWIKPSIAVVAMMGIVFWAKTRIDPMPKGPKTYLRIEKTASMDEMLERLAKAGVVRDPWLTKVYSVFRGAKQRVVAGTFLVRPGMTADQVFRSLASPISQFIRIPQGRWAGRVGRLLESNDVAPVGDYVTLVNNPKDQFSEFNLPVEGSTLEGFLYPDTYDLPPMSGAKLVIQKQLANFVRKTSEANLHPKDWKKTLTVASLLQLEASDHHDRQMIAGVIQNRMKLGMRLQIDATVNYGLQKWRRLTYADYKEVDSPYNTYLAEGLPPGPICSPTVDSMLAAESPIKHNYLYYVALPDGRTIYASNYKDHLKNVQRRRHELKLLAAEKAKSSQSIANVPKVIK